MKWKKEGLLPYGRGEEGRMKLPLEWKIGITLSAN